MKKIKRMLAGILLATVAITAVVGGSVAEVEAKVKRCTEAYVEVGEGDKEIENGKTASMTMCKGMTSEYHYSIFYPFGIKVWCESHKITATSSKPSVVSVSVKSKKVILNAKKCGTATVTMKSSCGNKFKIKVTVKDHKYVKDGYATQCECCEQYIRGVDVTEEEIHQRLLDAVGDDRMIYGDEIPGYNSSWVCKDWQDWISKQVWGFGFRSSEEKYNRQKLSESEYKNVRSGDMVFMPNHVCMVAENLHDGTFTVTVPYSTNLKLGTTEEKGLELWHSWSGDQVISYDSDRIDAIYTYYRN